MEERLADGIHGERPQEQPEDGEGHTPPQEPVADESPDPLPLQGGRSEKPGDEEAEAHQQESADAEDGDEDPLGR